MRYRNSPSPSQSAVLACLLALLLAAAGCNQTSAPPATTALAERENEGSVTPTAEAGPSDLDQPVEDLLAAVCEHTMPTYTCAECRYEVGVARAGEEMFDPARGGTLATIRAGSRPLAGGKDANGEVRLNEERAVYLSPLAPGVVRAIVVDVGARVRAGQVLFEVESSEYRQAKADLLRAEAVLNLAEATATRERDLYEKGICPRKTCSRRRPRSGRPEPRARQSWDGCSPSASGSRRSTDSWRAGPTRSRG